MRSGFGKYYVGRKKSLCQRLAGRGKVRAKVGSGERDLELAIEEV